MLHGRRDALGQFARFVAVGATNTAISSVVYAAVLAAGVTYLAAGALGFSVGAVNGYVLNRRWTFKCTDTRQARLRYVCVQLAGLGATTGLLRVLVAVGSGRLPAYLLSVPIVTVGMFLANRSWTWGRPAEASPAARTLDGWATPS